MATNPYVNKVEVDGVTLIDLTQDTVTAGYLYAGIVAHAADGSVIVGSYTPPTFVTQSKAIVPTTGQQVVAPDIGYDGLSQVTVEPIPSNYGLITWDGNVLTVS